MELYWGDGSGGDVGGDVGGDGGDSDIVMIS